LIGIREIESSWSDERLRFCHALNGDANFDGGLFHLYERRYATIIVTKAPVYFEKLEFCRWTVGAFQQSGTHRSNKVGSSEPQRLHTHTFQLWHPAQPKASTSTSLAQHIPPPSRAYSMEGTFHRRELKAPSVAFSSQEGKELFRTALTEGGMEGYFHLSESFQTQVRACGRGNRGRHWRSY
jgi:hypothetical protein